MFLLWFLVAAIFLCIALKHLIKTGFYILCAVFKILAWFGRALDRAIFDEPAARNE